jgi:hypothetical protein
MRSDHQLFDERLFDEALEMTMKYRIHMRRSALAIAAASLVAAMGTAQAAGEEQAVSGVSAAAVHSSAGAGLTVEQRLREEMSVVVMDLIQSGAFGNTAPQQIAMDIDAPPQKVSNLGLLVDSKGDTADGLHVLAVTPGGNAERMGLRAGDVLLALNGTALTSSDGAASLRRTVDTLPDGGRLDFNVRRDGRAQTMGGASASMYLPAMHLSIGNGTALASNSGAGTAAPSGSPAAASPAQSNAYGTQVNSAEGCGRISAFDVAPRQQQLHAATLIAIDGVAPGPSGAKAYPVRPGHHVVKVGERIESRYLSFPKSQRNAPLFGGYKTVDVDVEPNTTYFIAAHLNEDQRNNPIDGAYWDPVMWKQVAETCR